MRSWVQLIRTYRDADAVARAVLVDCIDAVEVDRYAMLLFLKSRRRDT